MSKMGWKQFWSRLLFRPNSWARDFRIQHPSASFGWRLIFWPQFWSGNLRIPHPFAFLEAGYFSDRNSDREILEFCIIICSFFFNNDISLVNIIPIRIPVKKCYCRKNFTPLWDASKLCKLWCSKSNWISIFSQVSMNRFQSPF